MIYYPNFLSLKGFGSAELAPAPLEWQGGRKEKRMELMKEWK